MGILSNTANEMTCKRGVERAGQLEPLLFDDGDDLTP
jgi:hypothetical protein